MTADKKLLGEIFHNGLALEIPFFQRAYVWQEEQWERLLEDLKELSFKKGSFFLGSIILKKQESHNSHECRRIKTIVDGQQRLTTLLIILKALSLKENNSRGFDRAFFDDEGKITLKHNYSNYESFEKVMELEKEEELKAKEDDNIILAYNFYIKNIKTTELTFKDIMDYLEFVVIELEKNEDEQQIFDSINSLGVKLTTGELLKNYFFKKDNLNYYEKYWKNIFEINDEVKDYWDSEISKKTFIDILFYSYLQIKINDEKYNVTSSDKILFTKIEKAFESYRTFIEKYCKEEKDEIIKELGKFADVFKKTLNKESNKNGLSSISSLQDRISYIIFAFEQSILIPYVLFIELNLQSMEEKNEIYKLLESYFLRRITVKAQTNSMNKVINSLIYNKILSKAKLAEFLKAQNNQGAFFPDNKRLKNSIFNDSFTNDRAKKILYFLESSLRSEKHSTQLHGVDVYSLEHIMPIKWEKNWDENLNKAQRKERDRKIKTLGNLTIITNSLNSSIKNSSWEIKKDGDGNRNGLRAYSKDIEIMNKFLDLPLWNEGEIEKRALFLYEKFIEIFPNL